MPVCDIINTSIDSEHGNMTPHTEQLFTPLID